MMKRGVRRFRTIEEMDQDWEWPDAGDPIIPRQIRRLWGTCELLVQPIGLCIPRGVRKYRSIEDANADSDRWETERVQRLRAYRESQMRKA